MDDRKTSDGRTFYWLANVPYQRADGSATEVAIWHSKCAVCGAAFSITTPTNGESKAFGRKHCDDHKLPSAHPFAKRKK